MKLRPYQQEAVSAVIDAWKQARSTMIVMPTGCGKTIVMSELVRRVFPRRVMFLAHREELIFQARDKIENLTGFKTEIEMADSHVTQNGLFNEPQVIISTIQTQTTGGDGAGRMGKFVPDDFGYLFCDEGHHAVSSSWKRAIKHYQQNHNLKILGVTATPDRLDKNALGQVFDSVAYEYEAIDAIRQGWLVPIEQQMIRVEGLDFSGVRTTAGDLNGKDLAKVLEFERNLHGFADPTIKLTQGKRTLVFAASVAQAERLSDILNRHMPNCSTWVCGKTDKQKRRKIISDFASDKIQYVVNCGVFTEGFDDPGVSSIVMARPTKSRSLYTQMAGRGMRPLAGVVDGLDSDAARCAAIAASAKKSCLVLDFVGNSGRHKLMTSADILGGNYPDEIVERAIERAKREGRPMRMDEALEEENAKMEAEREARKLADQARKAKLIAKAKFTATTIDPFDAFNITPQPTYSKDSKKHLTEKQESILLKQGIDPDRMSYNQARQLLEEQFRRWHENLCTLKQASLLKRYGYETKDLKMKDASAIIDGLARNGWRI